MPIPDLGPSRSPVEQLGVAQERAAVRRLARLKQIRAASQRLADRLRRGGKRPGGEAGETVPVEPNRPLDLTGGAAATLEFDD